MTEQWSVVSLPDYLILFLIDYLIPKKAYPVSVQYTKKDKPKRKSHKSSKHDKKSEKRSAHNNHSSKSLTRNLRYFFPGIRLVLLLRISLFLKIKLRSRYNNNHYCFAPYLCDFTWRMCKNWVYPLLRNTSLKLCKA